MSIIQQFKEPFNHVLVDNFLPMSLLKELRQIYSSLKLIQKQTDLFFFYQTMELNENKNLDFFKEKLNQVFSQFLDIKGTSFNIFASYYSRNNYLLCHDDVIQDRWWAFSFYLDDFNHGGQLILYDATATNPQKSLSVVANRLALFQVSPISFHEVAVCRESGRKAVTGWLNKPGQGIQNRVQSRVQYQLRRPEEYNQFQVQIEEQDFQQMQDIQYDFQSYKSEVYGPFYARRLTQIYLTNPVLFTLKHWALLSARFFQIHPGNYLLLNDPLNRLEGDLLDVFIISTQQEPVEEGIKMVNREGEVNCIPIKNNSVFIVRRGQQQYAIERCERRFKMGHLIYQRKANGAKKIKKKKGK